MTKEIKGVNYTTFPEGKTAKELGINTSRKFIVVNDYNKPIDVKIGDILVFERHFYEDASFFTKEDGKTIVCYWHCLAYYDEPKELRISTKTQAEWDAVVEKLLDMGKKWTGKSDEGLCSDYWNEYKEETEILVLQENDYSISYADRYFNKAEFPHIPLQSASEFLGYDANDGRSAIGYRCMESCCTFIGSNDGATCDGIKEINQPYNQPNQLIKPKGTNKFMSLISNSFKSKENKALEYFNLGSTDELNASGRAEFIDYVFKNNKELGDAFLKHIVELHKEGKKWRKRFYCSL